MKIIVLGGAGDMGSRAVEDLAAADGVSQVTVADRNITTAREIAARLTEQGAQVDALQVDADDHAGLVRALRGYDVAASALGPFHRYEVPMVRAAIEAGVHYASVCDEWEPARAVIEQFDQAARDQGLTVITGLGTSPGLTNLGIRYYAQRLDQTHKADVYVYQPLNAGGGEAVIRHMLHIIAGRVVAWRGGKKVMIPACSESRVVEFPRFGPLKVWNMGHSEPETVPRFVPGIQEVNFFMGFGRGSGFFVWPSRLGLWRSRRIRDLAARCIHFLESRGGDQEPGIGAVRADVWGRANGAEAHRIACGIGQMREATGLALSIGTLMLARGELVAAQGGVYAPEACLDPQKFITYLAAQGIQAYADVDMKIEMGRDKE